MFYSPFIENKQSYTVPSPETSPYLQSLHWKQAVIYCPFIKIRCPFTENKLSLHWKPAIQFTIPSLETSRWGALNLSSSQLQIHLSWINEVQSKKFFHRATSQMKMLLPLEDSYEWHGHFKRRNKICYEFMKKVPACKDGNIIYKDRVKVGLVSVWRKHFKIEQHLFSTMRQ